MKDRTKKIVVVLLAVLLVAAIAYYVYDIKVNGTPYNENLGKTVLVSVSLVAFIGKICTNSQGNRKPLSFYEKSYAKEIGNAFSRDAKSKKQLLEAIRYFNESEYGKAVTVLEKIKKKRPSKNDMAVVCLFSALCYESWGAIDAAIGEYRQSIANDDKNSTAYSNLAILYQKREDFDNAYECLCKALECNPENHFALNNLAQFYFKVGEYRAAVYYSQKALEIVPNFRNSATLLAVIFGAAGYDEQYLYYKNLAVSNGADLEVIEDLVYEMDIDLDADNEEAESEETEAQETEN